MFMSWPTAPSGEAACPPLMGSVGYFFGTASLAELIGITLASSLIVGASAPFVAGLVFDRTGSYLPVLIASVVLFGAGGALALLLKPPRSQLSSPAPSAVQAQGPIPPEWQ